MDFSWFLPNLTSKEDIHTVRATVSEDIRELVAAMQQYASDKKVPTLAETLFESCISSLCTISIHPDYADKCASHIHRLKPKNGSVTSGSFMKLDTSDIADFTLDCISLEDLQHLSRNLKIKTSNILKGKSPFGCSGERLFYC